MAQLLILIQKRVLLSINGIGFREVDLVSIILIKMSNLHRKEEFVRLGQLVDSLVNKKIEVDVTLPELQSFYSYFGLTTICGNHTSIV